MDDDLATGCDSGLTQVFDRTHRLVGEWSGPDNTLFSRISVGPDGEAFAITGGPDGSIVRLHVSLPTP
jgi:hypothetical protein